MPIATGLLAYVLLPFAVLGRGEKRVGDSIPQHKAIRVASQPKGGSVHAGAQVVVKGRSAHPGEQAVAKGGSAQHQASGGSKGNSKPGAAKAAPSKVQYGVASFYADKFEGRKTYTDEIFKQDSLTGASNTLPMRTWVKVTNLRNHQSVYVRINDKMHPRNKRLIDLSRAAAIHLGYTGSGLARVRIEVLGKKKPPEAKGEMAIRRPGQD